MPWNVASLIALPLAILLPRAQGQYQMVPAAVPEPAFTPAFNPQQAAPGGAEYGAAGGYAGGAGGFAGDAGGYAGGASYYSTTTRHVPAPAPILSVLPGTPDNSGVKESLQKLPTSAWTATQATACTGTFIIPQPAPLHATDFNGVALPDVCFLNPSSNTDGKHHVLVIGDWGGIIRHPWNNTVAGPIAADHRDDKHFKNHYRPYVFDVDDFAQRKVAQQMQQRAMAYDPDYILNVGDSFYWGGINIKCGAPAYRCADITGQWKGVFEEMYTGQGIDGKQWLGVLGNHDYGGFMFTAGWDQLIAYSWMTNAPSKQRWVIPAQYWKVKVIYADFSIDYLFVDTNVFDTWLPDADQRHNICSREHNPAGSTCGIMGPVSAEDCSRWFKNLWTAQLAWMESALTESVADWQIVVVHHPPEGMWGVSDWARLCPTYGIDLIIAGHRHRQEIHGPESTHNELKPTAYIVSGGGGGITAENTPDHRGEDDEYGFVDLTLSKQEIMIEAISHSGEIRSTTCVRPRQRGGGVAFAGGPSICDGRPAGPRPETLPPDMTEPNPYAPAPFPYPYPYQPQPEQPAWGQPDYTEPTAAPAFPQFLPPQLPTWRPHFFNPFADLLDRLRR